MTTHILKIVLLEDDQALAQAFERAMHKRGHNISCVNDIDTFKHTITNEQFIDLILMDLKLETESSLAYIHFARQHFPNAKIIVITGYASIATTVEAIKQGADDYLPKPVTVDEILRVYWGDKNIEPVGGDVLSTKRLEWEHIQRVLQDNNGNISKTAEQLNMHRRTLQRKLQKKPAVQ
jgi:two-component system response regulator RegA